MFDLNVSYYAVMGNPIAHSKSPFIHTAFARQTGEPIHYDALLVSTSPGAFVQAVEDFRAQGGSGLNVTIPFKQLAYEWADHHSSQAKQAKAVNTLWFGPEGQRFGDNTDGSGLVRDLTKNLGISLKNKRILLLGAGGAARGVLGSLLREAPATITVANRTVSKADELVELFSSLGPITASSYQTLAGQSFDLIINGTSASLQGELPPLPDNLLAPGAWGYDMMYGKGDTLFMQWVKTQGVEHVADGMGMLVEQAAEAFFIWRGIRPDTTPVIEALKALLKGDTIEIGGRQTGLDPTRYGDWEKNGRCIDF